MTAEVLARAGFEVETAENGKLAWELLSRAPFDALVADLNMPEMDGLELTRKLRADARLKDMPVLMLTVRDLVVDQLAGYERGADDYMTKPFDGRMLAARVTALIRRAGAPPPTRP
jgi:DNA-binding response OmpR family regulator